MRNLFFLICFSIAWLQSYSQKTISIAGNGTCSNTADGLQLSASYLDGIGRITLDGAGNYYFTMGHRIRKVNVSTGVVTTIAGTGQAGYSGDGGPAVSATLYSPGGIAIDGSGNIYISDGGNSVIRKITVATGIITTLAGNGTSGYNGDGMLATSASLKWPGDIIIDLSNNLIVADAYNYRIRKINLSTGIISTIAGTGVSGFAGDNGLAISAQLNFPSGIASDAQGNVFFSDFYNNRIRKVNSSSGIITTVAGNGQYSYGGDGGLATNAAITHPQGLQIDQNNNLIIADTENARIRKVVQSTGIITSIASSIYNPIGVAITSSGDILITGNNRLKKFTVSSGSLLSISGGRGCGDGGLATNSVVDPKGMVFDASGNAYIADGYDRIRKIDANSGIISTIFGNGLSNEPLSNPRDIVLDQYGNLYFSDDVGIFKMNLASGNSSLITGAGAAGLTFDNQGNLVFADNGANRVRKIDSSTGIITTIAGNGAAFFGGDGGPATSASLRLPSSVAYDQIGNLYISDTYNNRIRKVDQGGIITTYVQNTGTAPNQGDGGMVSNASTGNPKRLVMRGNQLYFSDVFGIRRVDNVTGQGFISTVGSGDLLTVASSGAIFFASNLEIKKLQSKVFITASNLYQLYNGSPKYITTTTSPGTYPVSVIYYLNYLGSGPPVTPINQGTYAFIAIVDSGDYGGSLTGTLSIATNSQTVTFNALPQKQYGNAPFTISATASSGLPITYSSGTTGVATVSGNTITIYGVGSTVITASQAGNSNFLPASATQTLTVLPGDQSITFSPLAAKTYGDPTFVFSASSSSGLPVTYTSTGTVLSINGGYATIIGAGTTTITANQTGSAYYNPATPVTQTLTVNKANQTISFGALSNQTFGASPFYLTGTSNSGLPLSYTSSNTSVATISGVNQVTIVGTGTTTITAAQAGNSNYNPATLVNQTLTITKANQTITFPGFGTKTYGDPAFSLSASSSSGLPITYASSNPSVATVSGNTVTIVNAGTATVTADQAGNSNFNSATTVGIALTVNKANQTITFPNVATKTYGDPTFSLSATSTSGLPVTYLSSQTWIATVSGNVVTIVGTGTTSIHANQAGNSNFNAANSASITLTVNKANQSIVFNEIPGKCVGDAYTLSAIASSGLPIAYSVSDPSVASLSGNVLTGVAPGTITVTALQSGNQNYNSATSVIQSFKTNNCIVDITTNEHDLTFCQNNGINLVAHANYIVSTYLWSTGETSSIIHVNNSGTYTVNVTFLPYNKTISKSITVVSIPNTGGGGISASSNCLDTSPIVLSAYPTGSNHVWSTGSNLNFISTVNPGLYTVSYQINGNPASACFELWPCYVQRIRSSELSPEEFLTDIESEETISTNSIYPNPASNEVVLHISEPAQMATIFHLLDPVGKIIYSGKIEKGEKSSTFNVSNLSEGIYILKYQAKGQYVSGKVVIIR